MILKTKLENNRDNDLCRAVVEQDVLILREKLKQVENYQHENISNNGMVLNECYNQKNIQK